MCGIAGIINHPERETASGIVERMTTALTHRGPDEYGFYVNEQVALGHRRLSIIDLDNGGQPLANEDGSVHIVFNGEIYNHIGLRTDLEQRGHVFRTRCDTEAIIHLYEEYGIASIDMLDGMFAFAIYDANKGQVLLARDRLGQKPLLYFRTLAGQLVFGSEFSSLKAHPEMPREYDLQALHDYLSFQYVPSPRTIYQQVYKLPPAHCLQFDIASAAIRVEPYWQLDFSKKTTLSFADATVQLRELLTESVQRRLMADVPLGAFLSGGVDSAIITGIMSKLCGQGVKTFTIGFNETQYDERQYAIAATEAINRHGQAPLLHHEKVVDAGDFDILTALVKHYGEPYSDASMLPTFLLCQFARESVTVALSGDGADELFAGYERYLVMKYTGYCDMMPPMLRRLLFGVPAALLPDAGERTRLGRLRRILRTCASNPSRRYLDVINRFSEEMKRSVYGEALTTQALNASYDALDAFNEQCSSSHRVEKYAELDIHTYLPGDILTKVDIASMACSLEVRNPFLDHHVAEFAASLPFSYKQSGASRKHILKAAFGDLLPPTILNRKKRGFGVPIAAWLRCQWRDKMTELLLDGHGVTKGFFSRAALQNMIDAHVSGKTDYSYPLWSILVFELFLQHDT